MSQICSCCGDKLKNSEHYEVICRDATEHEEKIKKVDELQENSNEDELKKEEEKKKRLESYRAELEDMDRDELDELLESLRAEIHELRKKLNPSPDEDKQSKEASLEFIAVDTYHSVINDGDNAIDKLQTLQRHRKKQSKHGVRPYNVLTFEPYESVTHSGDRLLMKMGSTDSDSVSDTSGDELLKSLGSVD